MDVGPLGFIFAWTFLWDLLNIIIINLVLSGDNAILIAMALRWLPPDLRKKGFLYGAGAAVALRIILTFIIAQVLAVPCIKLAGGIVLLWVAVKLFVQGFPGGEEKEAATVLQAVRIMLIADLTMSLDNVIAVAGVSHGNILLLAPGAGHLHSFRNLYQRSAFNAHGPLPSYNLHRGRNTGKIGCRDDGERPGPDPLYQSARFCALWIEALCAAGVILAGKISLRRLIAADRSADSTGQPRGEIEE